MSEQHIAEELTHLVGRRHVRHFEKQYLTLKNILTEQKMYATHGSLGDLMSYTSDQGLRFKGPGRFTTEGGAIRKEEDKLVVSGLTAIHFGKPLEERYLSSAICFCDIPRRYLAIHMKKYGFFGLSFPKEFLIEKGASPVFYISNKSPVYIYDGEGPEPRKSSNLYEHFDEMTTLCDSFMDAMRQGNPVINELQIFLLTKVFAFIKPFDAGRSTDDEGNYYVEREWRTTTEFSFERDDVCRIILPRKYADRLNRDFDNVYISRMCYAEDISGAEEMLEQLGHTE